MPVSGGLGWSSVDTQSLTSKCWLFSCDIQKPIYTFCDWKELSKTARKMVVEVGGQKKDMSGTTKSLGPCKKIGVCVQPNSIHSYLLCSRRVDEAKYAIILVVVPHPNHCLSNPWATIICRLPMPNTARPQDLIMMPRHRCNALDFTVVADDIIP